MWYGTNRVAVLQEKLQAQQKKLDERNAKAAAKRAAKKEKEAAKAAKKDKKGENDNSAMAAGATFDMEDAPVRPLL